MFKKFFCSIFLATLLVGCAEAGTISASLPRSIPVPAVDPVTLGAYVLIVVGSNTADESTQAIIDTGGCVGIPQPGIDTLPACNPLPHPVTDGSEQKIQSRVTAARQVEGRTPTRCLVRSSDNSVLLVFDVQYSGTSHRYSSAGFVQNNPAPAQSTFMGFGTSAAKASLGGYDTEITNLTDSRCTNALSFMGEMIEILKQTRFWSVP